MPIGDLSGKITRGTAYAFAAWVLLCRTTRDDQPGKHWSRVLQTALDEFLDAFPKLDAEGRPLSLPDRLSGEPDRVALAEYFARVNARGLREPPTYWRRDAEYWWWWVAKAWKTICWNATGHYAGRPRPPNPLVRDVTPEVALAALARHPGVAGPEFDSEDAMWIEAALRRLDAGFERHRLEGKRTFARQCSFCDEPFSALRPEDHILYCVAHTAWRAWEPIRDALWVLEGQSGAGSGLVRQGPPDDQKGMEGWYVGYAFTRWTNGQLAEKSQTMRSGVWVEDRRAEPRVVVANALRDWQRLENPLVACPLCGRSTPDNNDLCKHLWDCPEHPALKAAQRHGPKLDAAVDGLGERLRKLGIARQRAQAAVRHLLTACEKFSSDQGWNGEMGYSEAWCERPWFEAIGGASKELPSLRACAVAPDGLTGRRKRRAAALQGDVTRLLGALGDVVAACHTYWGTARDDHNPSHSAFPEWADKAWCAALQKGRSQLAESESGVFMRDEG